MTPSEAIQYLQLSDRTQLEALLLEVNADPDIEIIDEDTIGKIEDYQKNFNQLMEETKRQSSRQLKSADAPTDEPAPTGEMTHIDQVTAMRQLNSDRNIMSAGLFDAFVRLSFEEGQFAGDASAKAYWAGHDAQELKTSGEIATAKIDERLQALRDRAASFNVQQFIDEAGESPNAQLEDVKAFSLEAIKQARAIAEKSRQQAYLN